MQDVNIAKQENLEIESGVPKAVGILSAGAGISSLLLPANPIC